MTLLEIMLLTNDIDLLCGAIRGIQDTSDVNRVSQADCTKEGLLLAWPQKTEFDYLSVCQILIVQIPSSPLVHAL